MLSLPGFHIYSEPIGSSHNYNLTVSEPWRVTPTPSPAEPTRPPHVVRGHDAVHAVKLPPSADAPARSPELVPGDCDSQSEDGGSKSPLLVTKKAEDGVRSRPQATDFVCSNEQALDKSEGVPLTSDNGAVKTERDNEDLISAPDLPASGASSLVTTNDHPLGAAAMPAVSLAPTVQEAGVERAEDILMAPTDEQADPRVQGVDIDMATYEEQLLAATNALITAEQCKLNVILWNFMNFEDYNFFGFSDLKALEKPENPTAKPEDPPSANPLMPRAMTFSPEGDPILDPMRRPSFMDSRE